MNLVTFGGGTWAKHWTVLMQVSSKGSETPCDLVTLQACFLGHHNIVRRLCQVENIDVNFLDDDGYSALLLSVWNNHVEVVEALKTVKNVDWNVQSYKGKVRGVWNMRAKSYLTQVGPQQLWL